MRRFIIAFGGTVIVGLVVVTIISLIKPDTNPMKMGQGVGALAVLVGIVAAAQGRKRDGQT